MMRECCAASRRSCPSTSPGTVRWPPRQSPPGPTVLGGRPPRFASRDGQQRRADGRARTGRARPGDEVITTPMTFCASVNVIEHVGARPVLVDVEPDTLNIDPQRIAAAVTPRTRAILAVHYAGHPADLDGIEALARTHRLTVVEDAAHAIPARYKGRCIGSGTNPVAFSFYATKK